MKILKEKDDKIVAEIGLNEVRCPYCDAKLKIEDKEKLCKCKIVAYKKTEEKARRRLEKSVPLWKDKEIELDCFPSKTYATFRIVEELDNKASVFISEALSSPHFTEDFRELLSLSWEEIMGYVSKGKVREPKRKVVVYIGNLNFDETINYLKLRSFKSASQAFNHFLREKYEKKQ